MHSSSLVFCGVVLSKQGRRHGWTGVDMSTPLLLEGVLKIDADPLSLDGRCGGKDRQGVKRTT